ncbi:MAG: V-type ATPase 116kDa subunit family protein [Candidatus Methanoperedens sp.]|nr:V-type ATPase 116kDa subunit family protein [Candidatus Methanoperedens sp.]
MVKLFAAVPKDHVGKIICAIGDTEACHFIEKHDSKLDLSRKKLLLSLVERRIDELLFKIPIGEPPKIDIDISSDVDLMLCALANEVLACEKITTSRLVEIKKKLLRLKQVYSVLENFGETRYTYIFEAWVPEGKQHIITASLNEASNGKKVVYFSTPEFGETPPTMLSNPGMMKPFETLVKKYGLPSYYEIDPTCILFVTFPLIFGMMYGDVGHGVVLFLLSMGIFLSGKERFKKMVKFKDFSPILILCSIFSVFFGFLYGDFFGLKFQPFWLSPTEHITYFLELSVWVGVLHLVIGFILNAINLWKNKKDLRAIFQVQWIIFSGSSIMFFTNFLYKEFTIFINGFLVLMLFPMAGMVIGGMLINSGEGKSSFSGVFIPFYLGLKYALHLMSYMRLLIMALAHSTISITIIAISGHSTVSLALAGFITFVLIIVVETFIVFIQTLRLHWVEWFYLFYKGKGTEFLAFKF